jgi:hypothetical protein
LIAPPGSQLPPHSRCRYLRDEFNGAALHEWVKAARRLAPSRDPRTLPQLQNPPKHYQGE